MLRLERKAVTVDEVLRNVVHVTELLATRRRSSRPYVMTYTEKEIHPTTVALAHVHT